MLLPNALMTQSPPSVSSHDSCTVTAQVCMQALAVDVSLAALLGDNIYNFGELLLHPIVSHLSAAQAAAMIRTALNEFI